MSKKLPRGFKSDSEGPPVKIVEASTILSKKFPDMSKPDIARYLMMLGAGRVLALHAFDVKEAKETKKEKAPKKAKKGAKK